ncbi:MAG: putative quinol monooxygenase [Rhodoluna sp.]
MTQICNVIAIFTPKSEFSDEVKDLLLRVTPRVHDEAGCEYYALHEDIEGRLIFVEAWSTRQLWIEHMEEPTVKEILSGVEGKLVKDVEVFELYNLPAGVTGKGTLGQGLPA